MKIKYSSIILFVFLLFVNAISNAANGNPETTKKEITVNSTKFSYPLVKKWIQEFNLLHPDIQITLATSANEKADLQFVINGQIPAGKAEVEKNIAYVGRYALLPVTSIENPLLAKLTKKELDEKELKKLFFQADVVDEAVSEKNALNEQITVYSGAGNSSGSTAFATYFGHSNSQFRGKRIAGDDIYLLAAISKDPKAVTFNNLSYLFDTESRKLKKQLVLLPLDVKKDQREILRSGNLDQTISLLEAVDVNLVPVERVGFIYKKSDSVLIFLQWVADKGQRYNHKFGFLTLDRQLAQHEQKQLEDQFYTNR